MEKLLEEVIGLKAKIFDLIALTERKMAEVNELHQERQKLLEELQGKQVEIQKKRALQDENMQGKD